jgi:hypothetical protein
MLIDIVFEISNFAELISNYTDYGVVNLGEIALLSG